MGYIKDGATVAQDQMILQQPGWLTLALVVLALTLQCALVQGDADFESVRVLMVKDSSGKGGDPKDKYWRKWRIPMLEPLTDIAVTDESV